MLGHSRSRPCDAAYAYRRLGWRRYRRDRRILPPLRRVAARCGEGCKPLHISRIFRGELALDCPANGTAAGWKFSNSFSMLETGPWCSDRRANDGVRDVRLANSRRIQSWLSAASRARKNRGLGQYKGPRHRRYIIASTCGPAKAAATAAETSLITTAIKHFLSIGLGHGSVRWYGCRVDELRGLGASRHNSNDAQRRVAGWRLRLSALRRLGPTWIWPRTIPRVLASASTAIRSRRASADVPHLGGCGQRLEIPGSAS